MEKRQCDIDSTKNYLQGKMSVDEAADFEKNLEADPQFREDFEFNKELLESMRIHYKSELKNKLQDPDASSSSKIAKRPSRSFYLISGVAAAVVLLVAATFILLYERSDYKELFSEYYTPYYNVMEGTERSAGSESSDLAMRLYDRRRYEEAIGVFNEILRQTPENDTLRFYKAMSHLSLGQADSTIAQLNQMTDLSQTRFAEPARWYLGLAYLRNGDIDKAEQIFQTIVTDNDSYSDRAKEILEALD